MGFIHESMMSVIDRPNGKWLGEFPFGQFGKTR
jgi:hypothetical protein